MSLSTLTEELRRLLTDNVFDLFGIGDGPEEPEEEDDDVLQVRRKDVTEVEVEPTWIDPAADKNWEKVLLACFEALFPKADIRIDPVSAVSNEAHLYVDDEPVDGIDLAFEPDSFEQFMDDLQAEYLDAGWDRSFQPSDSSVFRTFKRKLK